MNQYHCAKIAVDCTKNDPVDYRAGGPEWLGFDFFVKSQDTEDMIEYISSVLSQLNIPENEIYIKGFVSLPESSVWTKERILEEIKKDADMLRFEATRPYSTTVNKKNNH